MPQVTQRVANITSHDDGHVLVVGLSREEEDDLYAHLERKYGAARVSGLTTTPYMVKVAEMSAFALSQLVTIYCARNQIKVLP